MKSEKNILIAFILNLCFSIFEIFGGIFTGSVAIISDAVHDIGDAISIGISFILEKKSKKQPDEIYTFGYIRYSVIGGVVTTLILLFSSVIVIYNATLRIIDPTPINYNGMILFGIVGAVVNFVGAMFTSEGRSLNQKAVNLHMLEDVLGWLVVLVGATIMHFTDFTILDPIMSIGVSLFIVINAVKNLKEALDLFLEKTPLGIDVCEIRHKASQIDGIIDVHHIHVWSLDGFHNYSTMHIVTNENGDEIKRKLRKELAKLGICHATFELELDGEHCHEPYCRIETEPRQYNHHHHCH